MEIAAAAGGVPALVDVPHSPGSGIGFRGFLLRNDSSAGEETVVCSTKRR